MKPFYPDTDDDDDAGLEYIDFDDPDHDDDGNTDDLTRDCVSDWQDESPDEAPDEEEGYGEAW